MAMPLYVDLDGTLIRGDTMQQAFLMLLRRNPVAALRAMWLLAQRSRQASKELIARHIELDAANLNWRPEVIDYVRRAKAEGRRVVLASGTWHRYAEAAAAAQPGLFDAVYGTDRDVNLIGPNKLSRLQQDVAGEPFEYLGDSHADVSIFRQSAVAGWVGGKKLGFVPAGETRLHRLCSDPNDRPRALLKLLRPHQWTKNSLVFLPLLASHRTHDGKLVLQTIAAAVGLSLVASALYVLNDLLDIDADQAHPNKRRRPLASGAVTVVGAAAIAAVCLLGGFALAAIANMHTVAAIAVYAALSLSYSVWLKRRLLVDAFTLAGLYSIRPVIGGMATGIVLSEWLTVFSAFFFASLAFLKRYTELKPHFDRGSTGRLPGRGYHPQDLTVVQIVGPVTGVAAVLVIAQYINSPFVRTLYARPEYLWAWCPLIGYWIVRSWMLAGRGTLHHDPVVFAFRDSRSYFIGLLMILTALAAGPIQS